MSEPIPGGSGDGPEGGPPKSWREQLRDIKNAAVLRYKNGVPEEAGKNEDEIRALRNAELETQGDRLSELTDQAEQNQDAHDSTLLQKAALALVESAREHVVEPVKGKLIPVIPKVTYVVLTAALAEEGIPPRKAMALAKVANALVGRRLQGKALDALGGLEQALDAIEDNVLRAQVKADLIAKAKAEQEKALARVSEGSDDDELDLVEDMDLGNPTDEELDAIRDTLRGQQEDDFQAQEQQYLYYVSGMSFSPQYEREVYEEEVERLTALLGREPTKSEVREKVFERQTAESQEDFVARLYRLNTDMGKAKNDDEKNALLLQFSSDLTRVKHKYSNQEFSRLMNLIGNREFGQYSGRRGPQNIEGILRLMRQEAGITLPAEQEAFMRGALQNGNSALRYLARLDAEERQKGAEPEQALQRAWAKFTGEVNSIINRIMSNTVVRHDEQFRLNYQEENIIRGIRNKLRDLGAEISKKLESETFEHHYGDDPNHVVKYDGNTRVDIEDIDRTYDVRHDKLSLGGAVEVNLAGQVDQHQERVANIHNSLHYILQGSGFEQGKAFTAKISTEFIDRLLLKNPEYTLGVQVYMDEFSKAIARNGGFIPDDFGLKNSAGLDTIEEPTLNTLLALLPPIENETPQQHRNRCLQVMRAGEVLAFALKADAFVHIKYALPKPEFKTQADGTIVQSARGQQTHSKLWLAVAPKIQFAHFHHLYGAPPDKPWIKSVYVPRDMNAYAGENGAYKENFDYEQVLHWDAELAAARSVGASEELRRDFYPHFKTLMEIEDQHHLGATENEKFGNYEAHIVKLLDASGMPTKEDDIPATITQLRRLGVGVVNTYISKKLDYFVSAAYTPSFESRVAGRGTDRSLSELQRAYLDAKAQKRKAFVAVERSGRVKRKARRAAARLAQAEYDLRTRIIELEVMIPLRDAMPSSMFIAEKLPYTPDLEVAQGKTIQTNLNASVKGNPFVQAFLSAHKANPLAGQYVDNEVAEFAMSTQSMLETFRLKKARDRYDSLMQEARDTQDVSVRQQKTLEARALMDPANNVFVVGEVFAQEDMRLAMIGMYNRLKSVSKGPAQSGFNIGAIFPKAENFVQFMQTYSTDLQLAIGDMHQRVADDIGRGPGIERYELYGTEDGRSVSSYLKERRALEVQLKAEPGRTDLRDRIDQINRRYINGWVGRHAHQLKRDSIARRAAMQLLDRRGPIATELFNKDVAMDQVSWTKLGSNFAEKQQNNGIKEQEMIAASSPLWFDGMDKFVSTAKSGTDGLKGALGSLSGPLKNIAKMMQEKDPLTAPRRVAERILMVERFLLENPAARMQVLGIKVEEAALREKRPINLMGTAAQASDIEGMNVYTADRDSIKYITESLVSAASENCRIEPHAAKYVGIREVVSSPGELGTNMASGLSRLMRSPIAQSESVAQSLARFARRIQTGLESRGSTGRISGFANRLGGFLEGVAARIPTRTTEIDRRIHTFLQRFNRPGGRIEKWMQYEEQDVSLDLLKQIQGNSGTFDKARLKEDWPKWLIATLAAFGILVLSIIPINSKNDSK